MMNLKCSRGAICCCLLMAMGSPVRSLTKTAQCQKVVLNGEVSAGREWKAAFGEGWVFRVLPIQSGIIGYSGWDLVVDRDPPAGYPDALLLATPPYRSINEREVGTTYGLRAQDAIGWNPRSFHFLTSQGAFRQGQKLFLELDRTRPAQVRENAAIAQVAQKLMEFGGHAAAGEFLILDARLTPGIADAAPYAENWAAQSEKTPHEVEPSADNHPKPRGELHGLKFSITLWLPAGWKAPSGVDAAQAPCAE
jgi:hypothetical protein